MTWGDKIRNMTDEELAEWLESVAVICRGSSYDQIIDCTGADGKSNCEQCWLDWLREAEE